MRNSGKLLIFAILALAVLMAGASWWFRYSATRRAAQFWGPDAVRLIRDAPIVKFLERSPAINPDRQDSPETIGIDVSRAPGLLHLRNALLEDRSFDWASIGPMTSNDWRHWGLLFSERESDAPLVIWFSKDCHLAISEPNTPVSCEPIAKGLATMFDEFAETPALSQ